MAKAAGRRSLATRTSCRRAHRVGDRTKIHDLRACPEWDAARKPSFRKASKGPFRALHRSNKGTIARALSVWNESQPLLPVKGWPSERSGRLGSAQATQACLQGGTPRSMRAMRSAIIGSRGLVMGSSGVFAPGLFPDRSTLSVPAFVLSRRSQHGPMRRAQLRQDSYISPNALKLATSARPTTTWSCTATPRVLPPSTTFRVISMSASDGA